MPSRVSTDHEHQKGVEHSVIDPTLCPHRAPLITGKVPADGTVYLPNEKDIGEIYLDVEFTDLQLQPKFWNPIWLQNGPLFGFIGLFGTLTIAMILLWHYSHVSHGFTLLTANHYAWTYGPTAVLVLVVSLWRPVDFWCKALTPWDEMSRGFVPANRSLLVDHVSPLQIVALFTGIRLRH